MNDLKLFTIRVCVCPEKKMSGCCWKIFCCCLWNSQWTTTTTKAIDRYELNIDILDIGQCLMNGRKRPWSPFLVSFLMMIMTMIMMISCRFLAFDYEFFLYFFLYSSFLDDIIHQTTKNNNNKDITGYIFYWLHTHKHMAIKCSWPTEVIIIINIIIIIDIVVFVHWPLSMIISFLFSSIGCGYKYEFCLFVSFLFSHIVIIRKDSIDRSIRTIDSTSYIWNIWNK